MNGVYGLKLNNNSVPEEGIYCMTKSFDALGPIANDPEDLVSLAEVMTGSAPGVMAKEPRTIDSGSELSGWKISATDAAWGVHETMYEGKWDQPELVSVFLGYDHRRNRAKH